MNQAAHSEIVDSREEALARARAYELFGELFLNGVTESLLPYLQLIPDLAHQLTLDIGDLKHINFDLTSADHYDLFGINIFPYESTFLDPSKNMGGDVTGKVVDFYQEIGYENLHAESPDHIGVELLALAFLCRSEHKAVNIGESGLASAMKKNQYKFIMEHLSRWLPLLSYAVLRQKEGFFSLTLELTSELMWEHFISFPEEIALEPEPFSLPETPHLLDDDNTGMRDIVEYLLTPAYSGIYFSQMEIKNLGRTRAIPRGFGNRRQMFTNMFRSAADYDLLPELLYDINVIVEEWKTHVTRHAEKNEYARNISLIWNERLVKTENLISKMISVTSISSSRRENDSSTYP